MPSTHRPIFCRKELREKVGVKVRFFIGVNQRTRADFLWQTKHRTYLTIFYRCHLAHTARFFIGAIVCDNGRRGHIVGLRHSDFLSD